MKTGQELKVLGTALVFAGAVIASLLLSSPRGRADDREEEKDSRIEQGFDIAPVHLNMEGLNPALVGLGSYIVNTEGCNDCHSAGPATQYAKGGNPFFGQPKKVKCSEARQIHPLSSRCEAHSVLSLQHRIDQELCSSIHLES